MIFKNNLLKKNNNDKIHFEINGRNPIHKIGIKIISLFVELKFY